MDTAGSSIWSPSVSIRGSDIPGAEYNATTGAWSATEQLASALQVGEYPAVAISGSQLVVVWDSGPNGTPDVNARVKPLAGYGGPDPFVDGYDKLSRLTSVTAPTATARTPTTPTATEPR